MNAESNEPVDDAAVTRAYRNASAALDERPDPRIRATVLAAAARAVDARPRDVARPAPHTPFGSRRWGWSIAAVLVVSVTTGLVAMNAWRERPDLVEGRTSSRTEAPAIVAPAADKTAAEVSPTTDDATPVTPRRETAPSAPASTVAAPPPVARATPKKAQPPAAEAFPKAADEPARIAAPAPPPAAPAEPAQAEAAATTPADVTPRGQATRADSAASTSGFIARPRAAAPVAHAKTEAVAEGAENRDENRDEREAESPRAWVVRIVRLRAAGRDDEADREVVKLRDRYPAFTIPREALGSSGTR